jgi:hypothetical protein
MTSATAKQRSRIHPLRSVSPLPNRRIAAIVPSLSLEGSLTAVTKGALMQINQGVSAPALRL